MKRSIITTADGSKTIQIEDWNEHYHSVHGALQEAKHVYIEMGLHEYINRHPKQKQLSILEIGFGTRNNRRPAVYHGNTRSRRTTQTR